MLTLNQQAIPGTPAAGKMRLFLDQTAGNKTIAAIMEDGRIIRPGDAELPNYLRNGGMWFARRQNPAAATNCGSTTLRAAGVLSGLDGWGAWNENANTTSIRVDTASSPETGLQGRFYGTWLKITTTGKFFISQMLEGSEACALRGRTVRLQTWMKGTASQTVRLGLVQLTSAGTIDTLPATFISAAGANGTDPTLGTNLSYIAPRAGITGDNCTTSGNAANCSVTTAWQRFGQCFDVPTNCKNLLACFWTDSQLTATNGFSLSQASLTDGHEIQNFNPVDQRSEIERCARIWFKTFNQDTLPAASVGVNSGEFKFMGTVVGALAMAGIGFRFPTPMRAAPGTLTLFNPAAAGAQVRNVTDSADMTSSAITANGEQGCWINCTGAAGNAAGEHLAVHLTADAAGTNNEFA